MSDLMPCQMCGDEAYVGEDEYDDQFYFCDRCRLASPTSSGFVMQKHGYDFETPICHSDRLAVAKAEWNKLQTYIARGKLLDDATKSKGGRL